MKASRYCYISLPLLLFSSYFTFSSCLSTAEASLIARRQLLALRENAELPDNYEYMVKVNETFANCRLRRAYIGLQAWKEAMYSDPLNTTGNWVGPSVCKYNGVFCSPALDDPKLSVVAGIDLNHAHIACTFASTDTTNPFSSSTGALPTSPTDALSPTATSCSLSSPIGAVSPAAATPSLTSTHDQVPSNCSSVTTTADARFITPTKGSFPTAASLVASRTSTFPTTTSCLFSSSTTSANSNNHPTPRNRLPVPLASTSSIARLLKTMLLR